MDTFILQLALQNAIQFGGKTQVGIIMGKVISQKPEADKKKLISEIQKVVTYVNGLSLDQQQEELEHLGGPVEKVKVIQEKKFPELVRVGKKVVMRFAPNPSAPLHLGHLRQALWNWFFVEHYKGNYLLRFDDTDPQIKVPLKEAYTWIEEDLAWLGIKPHKIIIQSQRLNIYYDYAEQLLQQGHAYICTCDINSWRDLIRKGMGCSCRLLDPEIQLQRWKEMFTTYKAGEAVYRVKTDLDHKDPAARDFPGFRIVSQNKHPLEKKAKVWPLLNFASAIDDHEFKVTHILRGIDLQISDVRQNYIYKYFGWTYPVTQYSGKFSFGEEMSKSAINKRIAEGTLSGFDDPRLGTLQALRRRGFLPEAIKKLIYDIGINKSNVDVSFDQLASYNRDLIDSVTCRYHLVLNPREVLIKGANAQEVTLDLHPNNKTLGNRTVSCKDRFYISDPLKRGTYYRLMHLLTFKEQTFVSSDYDATLKPQVIHWVAVGQEVPVEVVMDTGETLKGVGEKALTQLKEGDLIQAERVGFLKLDQKLKHKLVFYYLHP